jgi:molybdopterin synthase catalytic subunit
MFVQGAIPGHILQESANTGSEEPGAIAVFIGKVRGDVIEGKRVASIEFTAQQLIAEKVAGTILEESKKQFGLSTAEIWHSLGKVKTGEACFYVRVVGKHREESFHALPYIVNEVKRRCPVFGREIFSDGDYQWKENKI